MSYTYVHRGSQLFTSIMRVTVQLATVVTFVIHVNGVRLCLWNTVTNKPIVHPPNDIWVWRAMVEWYWQGKIKELGEKPVLVLLCPPQIPHGLTQVQTWTSTVRGRWLTTWFMATAVSTFIFVNTVCIYHLSCVCYIPCPSHPCWFDKPSNISNKIFVFSLLHYPVTSFALGPNNFLSTIIKHSPMFFPKYESPTSRSW
jgi:hypothetical protein